MPFSFNKVLSECGRNKDYIRVAVSKNEYRLTESLFMILVLQQQKMTDELIAKHPNRIEVHLLEYGLPGCIRNWRALLRNIE